jgi:hypothetical protein
MEFYLRLSPMCPFASGARQDFTSVDLCYEKTNMLRGNELGYASVQVVTIRVTGHVFSMPGKGIEILMFYSLSGRFRPV